ncbi:hypothetical protein [Streptomyces sp. SM12]|uniref:hypothetical protein n=1 Tax=Streptomyces sp. SM12 TaxID=1071602 RepID=UPI0015E1913B|nr:hypothetical protein [Streptomyces sp. SM12]
MIRSRSEVVVDEYGAVALPESIPGETLLAFSEGGGRIVLRRPEGSITDLLNGRPL